MRFIWSVLELSILHYYSNNNNNYNSNSNDNMDNIKSKDNITTNNGISSNDDNSPRASKQQKRNIIWLNPLFTKYVAKKS